MTHFFFPNSFVFLQGPHQGMLWSHLQYCVGVMAAKITQRKRSLASTFLEKIDYQRDSMECVPNDTLTCIHV